MTARDHLILFTRYPEPGTTKTRLIPALGEQGAADLQRAMTEHTFAVIRGFSDQHQGDCTIEVRYEGGSHDDMRSWLGNGTKYHPQGDGDLGDRMAEAFADALADGAESVLLMGSDCPQLGREHLDAACSAIRSGGLTIGPAKDGGYYLIGMHRDARPKALPGLFQGIDWGSSSVLADTLSIVNNLGVPCHLLECLADVDRPEDLDAWELARTMVTATKPLLVSVIIPALNEADHIGETLNRITTGNELEIIVVDGGSTDDTVAVARAHGAQVIEASRGRASQLTAGVAAASGEYLLLLHADTLLEKGFDRAIREILAKSDVACGAFTLRIDSPLKKIRVIERTTHFRATVMHKPYGDQGLFMRAETLHQAGGIPNLPIMEDFELVRRLGKRGTIIISPLTALTSARRWHTRGFWTTTLLNQAIILAYYTGVPPQLLKRWYDGKRT